MGCGNHEKLGIFKKELIVYVDVDLDFYLPGACKSDQSTFY